MTKRSTILIAASLGLSIHSASFAQTAQDVPVRSCPELMDYYPQRALREELTGKASYSLSIGPVGQIIEIAIAQSSGHDILDQAGIKFLQRCRFMASNNPNATVRKTVRSVNFVIPE